MGWKLLIEYYADQRKDLSDDERIKQRNIYFKFLKDMDGSLWQEVVGVAIQSSKWFPRIAELVEYAAQLHRVRVPDQGADAAFEHALTAVRRLDPFSRRPMSPVRDDVDRTVRSIGGWGRFALIETDQLGWYRKEFIAAWEGAHGLRERLGVVGDTVGQALDHGQREVRQAAQRALGSGQPDATTGEGVLDAVARSLEGLGPDQNDTWEGKS
jgi:hypothetical protein